MTRMERGVTSLDGNGMYSGQERKILFCVVGNAFLHSMVRTMVGTLVEVGRGSKSPAWVGDVLAACDRRAAGQNAPAAGLVFWDVEYPEDMRPIRG